MQDVTEATFEDEVLNSDLPVLVDYWASWCGPCLQIAPVLEELAAEYNGRIRIVKVDTMANPKLTQQFGILSIPTVNVHVGGEVVRSIVGGRPKKAFVKEIEAVLAEFPGAAGSGAGAGAAGAGA